MDIQPCTDVSLLILVIYVGGKMKLEQKMTPTMYRVVLIVIIP